jgi:type I site-specific restriction-modification system R (restriction) subunit
VRHGPFLLCDLTVICTHPDYPAFIPEDSEVEDVLLPLISSMMSMEFIHAIAGDIVHHFASRQKNFAGKGVVAVPDIRTGTALSRAMASATNSTQFRGLASTISSKVSFDEREILIDRFRNREDALSLLIATGSFLQSLDNPFIHTVYVISPISLQLRYQLAGMVSRPDDGKKDGLIVDYVGLNWELEDLS